MSDESTSQTGDEHHESSNLTQPSERPDGARMSARRWVIAYRYFDPVDYEIPALPGWHVSRTDSNGLSLARDDESEPFITAEHPVRVRR